MTIKLTIEIAKRKKKKNEKRRLNKLKESIY